MLIQGQVGPTSAQSTSPGSTPPVRLGQLGDVIVSELHGRYYETGYRRAMYTASMAAQTVSTGLIALNAAYTGLSLYNPIGSNYLLAMNKVGVSIVVAPAAASGIGIATGTTSVPPSSTTVATAIRSSYVTGITPNSVAQAFNIVTYGAGAATNGTTPVVNTILGQVSTTISTAQMLWDLEGSIILPPGAFASLYFSTAPGASGTLASFQWEEIPL